MGETTPRDKAVDVWEGKENLQNDKDLTRMQEKEGMGIR